MKKDLGLYLHIPFCVKKCGYCDFLSRRGEEEEKEIYVQALIREIKSYKEFGNSYKVSTVFLGGGTPSCMEPGQISRMFDAVQETFHLEKKPEISMEVNPGTVTQEKLQEYREAGVNRLSIGLQSSDDENLKLLTDESELIKCLSKSMEVESAAIWVIAPSANFILLLSVIILPLSKFTPVTA